ncbi:4-hydroxy-3-methylbut-2-enyl diphosphate reductase 2 [Candidatus Protofrankia californiensis]|uniref:4-hydroxy-3-methylbut-2-enyl diphosphate reductase 2 n=1 Tax=Candidatus Protofrankia californiensis TaxID=1839754 RepID=A0A1C3NU26_9ACTN|nr:4-hydroxy-3-methylbut-2-enyl diphosphate reductase 2 [Candidatus Protofrankia californiensis]
MFVDELDDVPAGSTVVFAAHGVAPAVHTAAAAQHLQVIDATCPLVSKVHAEARRSDTRGEQILLIGHADHEEVEGTRGVAPSRTVVIEDVAAARTVEVNDPARVAYLTQTTLSVEETKQIVEVLRVRFPALREPASDDICYATTNRQRALAAIAAEADLVLVLGSTNSSNSQRLAELARHVGTPAYLIDDAEAVRPEWLHGAAVIGVTAGASAPPNLVEDLLNALRRLGPLQVQEHTVAEETVTFAPPQMPRAAGTDR